MTFITFPHQNKYIRRERFFVNSTAGDVERVESRYDVVKRLPKRVYYVQAVELADFNIPQSISPTFFAPTTTTRGNNKLDVWIGNESGGVITDSTTFTAEFTTGVDYSTDQPGMKAMIEAALDSAVAALGHPTFTNVEFTLTYHYSYFGPATASSISLGQRCTISAVYNPATGDTIRVRLLFASGPNAGNSCERVLGFQPLRDTELIDNPYAAPWLTLTLPGGVVATGALSTRIMSFNPSRYVDIRVRETQKSYGNEIPVGRIFFPQLRYIGNRDTVVKKPRLLTFPIPYTDTLRVNLSMEGEVAPNPSAELGWDVIFDLLMISPEVCVPKWVHTRLAF